MTRLAQNPKVARSSWKHSQWKKTVKVPVRGQKLFITERICPDPKVGSFLQ